MEEVTIKIELYTYNELDNEIKKKVEIYGRVGTWNKSFCSEECLERYENRTEQLMKTRRPNVCMKCLR